MTKIHAPLALTPNGWSRDVRVVIGEDGKIADVLRGVAPRNDDLRLTDKALVPAPGNLHSHSFQRAMAGMTQARGADPTDSFWTWRSLLYQFLERLRPDHLEAIAAQAFMEMLEAGYGAVAEFHYVHLAPGGAEYDDPGEMSARIAAAAAQAGIGLTHLPVLYAQGGVDGRALEGGQKRFGRDVEFFAEVVAAAQKSVGEARADYKIGVAPHSLRAVSRDELKAAVGLIPDGPLHIHIAEQAAEVEDVEAAYGARPVEWLLANAEVTRRWCLIHATHMTGVETRALAMSGATAGLAPVTEADLGDGVFNAAEFIAAKGVFGVGTDSNVRISLRDELRMLEYSQRLTRRERNVLAAEGLSTGRLLFDQACRGGARALGRNAGAIASDYWGDLLALDLNADALYGLSGDAVLDGWIFAEGERAVTDVWSAGSHCVQDGRHVARESIEATFRETLRDLRG